jgi:hypothetical protein
MNAQNENEGLILNRDAPVLTDPREGYKQVAIFSILTLFTYLAMIGFTYYTVTTENMDTVLISSIGVVATFISTLLLGLMTVVLWGVNFYEMWRNNKIVLYSTYYLLLPIIVMLVTMPIILK